MTKKYILFFLVLVTSTSVFAQGRYVTGTVTSSEDKLPIPGVTVVIEGTSSGVVSDVEGQYKIEVKPEHEVLVFSFVGMKTQKKAIGTGVVIDVVLDPDIVGIEEIVVTVPYGVQKKESFTGTMGLMQAGDINKRADASIDKMLQGAVAGVASNTSSGQPGSKSEVRIRGIGSINASSEPLYVIDGIPVSSGPNDANGSANILSTLNPNDIEAVSVLKDAAATSLYGSRASNGVIMITTKKGADGKTSYAFSTQQGVMSKTNSRLKMLNTEQFLELKRESMQNANYDSAAIADAVEGDTVNTNWLDEAFGLGYTQNYELSASGGNEKTSFYVSGSFKNDKGIVINTGLRRMTGRVNVQHKATDKVMFGTKVMLANTLQQIPHDLMSSSNEITGAYTLAPNIPVMKNDSTYYFDNNTFNLVGISELDKNTNTTNRAMASGFVEYKPVKKITLKSINSIDFIDFRQENYASPLTPDGLAKNGVLMEGKSQEKTITSSNTAAYDTKIGEWHSLNAVLGYEVQYSRNDSMLVGTNNFPSTEKSPLNTGTNIEKLKSPSSDWAIVSYLSNLQYNFRGRYYISFSIRRDGSSRFSAENRWSNFWSSGLSWRVSDEQFMKGAKSINSLRLRASYGTSGNSEVGNYASSHLFEYDHNYNGDPGGYPVQLGNPNLTWEKNNNADVGVEFRIFERIAGSVDVYHRRTWDLLLNVPISATNGFDYQLRNVGEMVNKGVELTLSTQNIKTQHFTWQTDFNISSNKNEVTKLYEGQDIIYKSQIRREGEAFNTFYLADWAGVNPADGSPMWYDSAGNITKEYSNAQKVLAGSADPKFITGLGNTFTYKNVSFSFSFYCKYGNKVYNNTDEILVSDGAFTSYNQSLHAMERWQKPGDKTDVPKLVYNNPSNSNQTSTRYLVDGSYVKLKDVMLSYSLPSKFVKKMKIASATVFVQGQNLWTWTRFEGIDPEQNIRGVSWFRYPNCRTVLGGLSITL